VGGGGGGGGGKGGSGEVQIWVKPCYCPHSHTHTHIHTLQTLASFTGQPDHDHTDTITALDAAPKLKLFASCGQDATVRIWTEDNHPVRSVSIATQMIM